MTLHCCSHVNSSLSALLGALVLERTIFFSTYRFHIVVTLLFRYTSISYKSIGLSSRPCSPDPQPLKLNDLPELKIQQVHQLIVSLLEMSTLGYQLHTDLFILPLRQLWVPTRHMRHAWRWLNSIPVLLQYMLALPHDPMQL